MYFSEYLILFIIILLKEWIAFVICNTGWQKGHKKGQIRQIFCTAWMQICMWIKRLLKLSLFMAGGQRTVVSTTCWLKLFGGSKLRRRMKRVDEMLVKRGRRTSASRKFSECWGSWVFFIQTEWKHGAKFSESVPTCFATLHQRAVISNIHLQRVCELIWLMHVFLGLFEKLKEK